MQTKMLQTQNLESLLLKAKKIKGDYHSMVSVKQVPSYDWYIADRDQLDELDKDLKIYNQLMPQGKPLSLKKLLGKRICDDIELMPLVIAMAKDYERELLRLEHEDRMAERAWYDEYERVHGVPCIQGNPDYDPMM